ncbi:MAG TPA: GDSL-type esterase/lipase family protein [Bryobacteraceae bacterium]|nr:GDSL-type esterase/lipase family protein [Bryobacteraceae bacterium]
MQLLPPKATLVILTFLILMKAPDAMPAFKNYKVLDWRSIPAVLDFTPRKTSADPIEDEHLRMRPDKDAASYRIYRLNDPARAMDHFYEALRRTELGQSGAVTRIVHYGDSPTTADLITGDARKLLQSRFGDAGHGFCLLAKPWAWYGHNGVDITSDGWNIEPASMTKVRDGFYGLGGVSFRGSAGAASFFKLKDPSHTRVEVAYLRQPGGGAFQVLAEDAALGTVDTQGPAVTPAYAAFDIPPGARRFQIRVLSAQVRAFGVRFGKQGPGLEYDSLGLNGAYVSVLAKMFDARHWEMQLQQLRPDLVIINYGTNESAYAAFVDQAYGKELTEIVRRVRDALPRTSILMMSPMDRGQRESSGEIGTVGTIPRLVTIQQKVALETGCGFFNTFQAMGGPGTMGRWYQAEPRLVGGDFIHPMPSGARIVGNLLYQALFDGYSRFKVRKMQEKFASAPTTASAPK